MENKRTKTTSAEQARSRYNLIDSVMSMKSSSFKFLASNWYQLFVLSTKSDQVTNLEYHLRGIMRITAVLVKVYLEMPLPDHGLERV